MSHEYAWYAGGDNGTKLMHTRQDILCEEKEERKSVSLSLSLRLFFPGSRVCEYSSILVFLPPSLLSFRIMLLVLFSRNLYLYVGERARCTLIAILRGNNNFYLRSRSNIRVLEANENECSRKPVDSYRVVLFKSRRSGISRLRSFVFLRIRDYYSLKRHRRCSAN